MKHNIITIGATRRGKTLAAARAATVDDLWFGGIYCDPHWSSLGRELLVHLDGNVLYDNLSDVDHALGYAMLVASTHADPRRRAMENQQRVEGMTAILLRRTESDSLAGSPLKEEWTHAGINLQLSQDAANPKTPDWLPYAFIPGTPQFAALLRDCTLPEIRHKFEQLAKLSPRGLRAEVGSAARLINGVFGSPAYALRSMASFDLGAFLQRRGKLILERGQEIGDDAQRTIMGAVMLIAIEHCKRRGTSEPPIRIVIDEATNARLVGAPELRALAETSKNGLYFTFLVQNLDFPGNTDAVLQNCLRHEWFGCPNYDLARKGAVDVLAGLTRTEQSRAERLDELTHDIMTLKAGWRWVRDEQGSRKEYVPLLVNPWPEWPGLRDAKLQEKVCRMYQRPEYHPAAANSSAISCGDTPPSPGKSPEDSSLADRCKAKRRGRKPADGS